MSSLAEMKAKIENYKKQTQSDISQNEDYLIKIDPEEDIITAVDKDENELHRLFFEVDGKKLYFRTPKLCNMKSYQIALAEMTFILAKYAGELELDDKKDFVKNPTENNIQRKLLSVAIGANQKVRDLCIKIFFQYLDGQIENIKYSEYNKKKWWSQRRFNKKSLKHNIDWFNEHARVEHLYDLFIACKNPDEILKKKGQFNLGKMAKPRLHPSKVSSSKTSSAPKPDSTQQNGNLIQFFS